MTNMDLKKAVKEHEVALIEIMDAVVTLAGRIDKLEFAIRIPARPTSRARS